MPKSGPGLCFCVPDSAESYVLLVSNLRKSYTNFPAIKGLNFGVKEKECFGLLGTNGAGKTTTFRMLVGEILPTTGNANILGHSLINDKKMYTKQIGYCPQLDALNLQLTTRELLTLFTNLRGIHRDKTQDHVNHWLNIFDLMEYHNIEAKKLSGGNKRKLSSAIALLGDPPVIMLDEPTSGMDAAAKRNLWRFINEKRSTGKAILLTSHSMDECEVLCDRLAILVDGQMKCIGNIQYLKRKFARGYIVTIKLKHVTSVQSKNDKANNSFETQVAKLKSAIENEYECTLKDENEGLIMYQITEKDVPLGLIFQFMENLKGSRKVVEDFTVNDTSLEQVFSSFAKQRTTPTNIRREIL